MIEPHAFPNTGYKYQAPDPRNFTLESVQPTAPFPASYKTDLSALGVYMQGKMPDCVENGITLAKRYYDYKSDGVLRDLSRRFLAILTVKADGFAFSEGTNLENALKIARQTGICESTFLPDDHQLNQLQPNLDTFISAPITQDALTNAETHRINSYAFVGDKSFNGLKSAIFQNGVVILAMKIDKNWWTAPNGNTSWAAADILPLRIPTDSSSMGGHVVVAYAYDPEHIYIWNSFSENWGQGGHGWFGPEYIPYIYEAATVIDLTPEQYEQAKKANQIINTIDTLKRVQTPANTSIIASLIAQLWQKFTELFTKPLGLGRWAHAYGGVPRSPMWPQVRAAHLKKEPVCQVCGGKKKLTVHHLHPFHVDKSLELNPDNLMTLCEGAGNGNHHLIYGHFGNYATKWNPDLKTEHSLWLKRFSAKGMPID